MTTAEQTIDGLLGNGSYDEWRQMEQYTVNERTRTELNEVRFSNFREPGTTDSLYWDMRLLERVAYDYRNAMDSIAAGQTVDPRKVGQIHDVLTLAQGTVENDNDALDAAFGAGILGGFVAIPFAVLQLRAQRLEKLLKVLKEMLEQAKSERNESWVQGTINGAVTTITVFMPHLGLLTRGGILIGQWLLDDALGPSTSKAATAGSKTSYVVSHLGDAVKETEKLGAKTQRIAKWAGKVATVTGFAFDANEVLIGYRNLAKIQQAISQAKKAYDELVVEIGRLKPMLEKFQRLYQRLQLSIQSFKQNAMEARYALQEEIKRTGYQPQ